MISEMFPIETKINKKKCHQNVKNRGYCRNLVYQRDKILLLLEKKNKSF